MPAIPLPEEIRIGISSCLLGNTVRHDGGHKEDELVIHLLGKFATFVPICPEVEVGMGTPRPAIRLARRGGGVRLVEPRSGTDQTDLMRRWAEKRVREIERLDLSGYVLKKDSPSCGMERVKVWPEREGPPAKTGVGVFAQVLMRRLPLLPVEEEGRLHEPPLRESFVERVFAYRRMRTLFSRRWTVGDLIRFQAAEERLLLAHDPGACRKLGKLAAAAKGRPRAEVAKAYARLYVEAFAKRAMVLSG